jgi:hypothetical protein
MRDPLDALDIDSQFPHNPSVLEALPGDHCMIPMLLVEPWGYGRMRKTVWHGGFKHDPHTSDV